MSYRAIINNTVNPAISFYFFAHTQFAMNVFKALLKQFVEISALFCMAADSRRSQTVYFTFKVRTTDSLNKPDNTKEQTKRFAF